MTETRGSLARAVLASFISLTLLISACRPPEQPPPISISLDSWPGYLHAFVAQDKGFFTRNRVNVTLMYTPNYEDSKRRFHAGGVDGIFITYPDAILLDSEGHGMSIVYSVDVSTADSIVARPGISTMAGLNGSRIGIGAATSFSRLFIEKLLAKAGIDETDVQFEIVPPEDMAVAIRAGRVDAGHTWEPTTSEAMALGFQVIATSAETPGLVVDVLSFNRSIVRDRPREVQAIVMSLLEAGDFIRAHPEEAAGIIARKTGVSPGKVRAGITAVPLNTPADNQRLLGLPGTPGDLHATGEELIRFYSTRGGLDHYPDLAALIDPRFIAIHTGGAGLP